MDFRIIEPAGDETFRQWDDFVKNHPNGNIFQTRWMYELYKTVKGYQPLALLLTDSQGALAGVLLALIITNGPPLLSRFTARAIITGGPLVRDDNPQLIEHIIKAYLEKINGRAVYSQVRNLFKMPGEEIFKHAGFTFTDHLDIHISLEPGKDELLSYVHKERRRNIGRAENKGVLFSEVTSSGELLQGINLVRATYRTIGLPAPPDPLLLNAALSHSYARAFACKYEGIMIAFRIVLCYKDMVYDWYAGSDSQYHNKYPNDYLPWKIILWSKEKGYKVFDFGGAGKPGVPYGVREYKLKFGGRLVNFGRFERIHKPLLMRTGKAAIILYKWFKNKKF